MDNLSHFIFQKELDAILEQVWDHLAEMHRTYSERMDGLHREIQYLKDENSVLKQEIGYRLDCLQHELHRDHRLS